MSFPNIPNVDPTITIDRCDAINLLLSAIALEEMSLSKILTSQSEALQLFIKQPDVQVSDFLRLNESVSNILREVLQTEYILQIKLIDITKLASTCDCSEENEIGLDNEI